MKHADMTPRELHAHLQEVNASFEEDAGFDEDPVTASASTQQLWAGMDEEVDDEFEEDEFEEDEFEEDEDDEFEEEDDDFDPDEFMSGGVVKNLNLASASRRRRRYP